jgi:hypothetical protein
MKCSRSRFNALREGGIGLSPHFFSLSGSLWLKDDPPSPMLRRDKKPRRQRDQLSAISDRRSEISPLRVSYGKRVSPTAVAHDASAERSDCNCGRRGDCFLQRYLIFARMFSISSLRKARIVWVLTLPSEPSFSA